MSHVPAVRYTDQEIIKRFEGADEEVILDNRDAVAVAEDEVVVNEVVVNEVVINEVVPENVDTVQVLKKVITAKPPKEKKRNLSFKLSEEEKGKCVQGKWTVNYQGGDTYCVDGFSYLINNHCISKKTGALTLYLLCSKCGGRNILTNGILKKGDHPGHTCNPDPDNWAILEADLHLKTLGE